MPKSPNQSKLRRPLPKRSYHHGDLRRVLLDTTVRLIERRGLSAVSVREVAKMAGVSPGAPFRHFSTRTALLTAVAEQAMDRLATAIDLSLKEAIAADPLVQFRAIGVGFLRWAIANPQHFLVISERSVIDFSGSDLPRRHEAIRQKMTTLIDQAAAAGLLRRGDPSRYQIAGRALAYGLGRMFIDGQFPSWGLDESIALDESVAILDQFIASIKA